MNKKIAIIGTVGLPAKYGGFETLTEHLIAQKASEIDFLVYCSAQAYTKRTKEHNGAKLKYLPLNANGIQSIPYDIISIFHSLFKNDNLLILGVSGAIAIPVVKFFTRKKIATNIDGLEWKRDKWGKQAKRFLKFSEKIAVKYSDIVIADNKVIQDHIYTAYGKQAKLIAYGADHATREALNPEIENELPFLNENYAFKVCRIEPENNIELILEAFARFEKLNLVLVGNWSVSEFSKKMRKTFSGFDNIFLLDPIYDQQKLNQIRSNCYIYIHGHSAGGTNPSLVEAMQLRLPILAYGVNYNKETTNYKALYFFDRESLIEALNSLKEDNLRALGNEMSIIAKDRYSWLNIANEYQKLFN